MVRFLALPGRDLAVTFDDRANMLVIPDFIADCKLAVERVELAGLIRHPQQAVM